MRCEPATKVIYLAVFVAISVANFIEDHPIIKSTDNLRNMIQPMEEHPYIDPIPMQHPPPMMEHQHQGPSLIQGIPVSLPPLNANFEDNFRAPTGPPVMTPMYHGKSARNPWL